MTASSLCLVTACGVSSSFVPTAGNTSLLSPRPAQDVEVFLSSKPDRPFQEIGLIEVQTRSTFNPDSGSLVDQLRAVAAQHGCDGVIVSGSNDSFIGGPSGAGTLKGYRGTCIAFKDVKPFEPPHGAGGFVFDADVAAAQAVCAQASLTWAAGEAGKFTCSGVPANAQMHATSELRFCNRRLCAIDLVVSPAGNRASLWGDELRSLRKALEQKYGHAASDEGVEPPDCAIDPDACAKPGRLVHTVRWRWGSGEQIELSMAVDQTLTGDSVHRAVAMRVSYGNDGPRAQAAPAPSNLGL